MNRSSIYFISVLLFSFISFYSNSQIKKTFAAAEFNKGDIIRVPYLDIELLNREKDVENDSVDALVNFLLSHPNLKVQIGCHTDSRGNAPGNMQGSQYRADGIRNYLIKRKNISANRLSSKGYGESKIIITDEEISKAKSTQEKEKLNLINRRTELLILEVN